MVFSMEKEYNLLHKEKKKKDYGIMEYLING